MLKFIDIELTTYCNAKCDFCIRTEVRTKLQHLPFDLIKKLCPSREIHIIGIRGDCIFYPRLFDVIKYFNGRGSFVNIHTNASVHSEKWWKELGKIMKANKRNNLMFAIDGLEDTHSIYRKGTDFNAVIQNINAFLSQGGGAISQTLIFKHNQHQLEDIKKLMKSMGVRETWMRKSRSYNTDLQRPIGEWKTRHEMGEEKESEIICNHTLDGGCLYLRVDGQLRPCCFMGCDEWETPDEFNLKHHTCDEIYNHPKFQKIRETYKSIERCQVKCKCTFDDIVKVER